MSRSRVFWALVLLLLGFLLLLKNTGLLEFEVWPLFWPSILILVGVWFLWDSLSRTPPAENKKAYIPLDGAEEARIHIKHGAGRLEVSGGSAPDHLLSGTFGWGLEKEVHREASKLDVLMRPSLGIFPDVIFPWTWTSGHGLDWTVACNEEIPLDFVFETGAGEAILDLSHLQVREISVHTGASSTTVKMPQNAGQTSMKLGAGVASVVVQVPDGVAARIKSVGGLSSVNIDQGRFTKKGDEYISEGYHDAENKTDIRIETGVGSVKIG